MVIIIDFDDTLLNTEAVYKKLASGVLTELGISYEQFIKSKEKIKERWGGGLKFYDINRHSSLMSEMSAFSAYEIKKEILNFFKKESSAFLFDDVLAFLEARKNDSLILMTFGGKLVQKSKVSGSGIKKYFDNIIFTENKSKSELINSIIASLPKNEKIIFVDGKIEELKKTKELCPEIICVRIKRKEGRYTVQKTPADYLEIKNLKELDKFLCEMN